MERAIVSATEALKMAWAAGIQLGIDGEDLVLQASVPPPPAVLELLSRHKADILRKLREAENDTAPAALATHHSQEPFEFAPPGDPANDDEALMERVAIMMEANGWDDATALREARSDADRERRWRVFLRNTQRVLAAPEPNREALLARYQSEATKRYGERAGMDMTASLRNWIAVRGLH